MPYDLESVATWPVGTRFEYYEHPHPIATVVEHSHNHLTYTIEGVCPYGGAKISSAYHNLDEIYRRIECESSYNCTSWCFGDPRV
jgi:hypothetical protein